MALSKTRKLRWQLIFLAAFAIIIGVLAYPKEGQILSQIGIKNSDLSIRRGLDLQGGVYLVYEAEIPADQTASEALDQVSAVIRKRINPSGTTEAVVQIAENNRLIVQVPGLEDSQAVIDRIGKTARLEFLEVNLEATTPAEALIPTDVTGQDVARAEAVFDQFNRPIVTLDFKSGESTDKFAKLTTQIVEDNTQLLTLLDGTPVFGPAVVQQPILSGQTQLSGGFENISQAQETADLINGGALPVPIKLVAQQSIGPTLGAESIQASVLAAIIGFISVAIFLIVQYRLSGIIAVASIIFYSAATLVIFKLSTLEIFSQYTIVLTLAGIAGFIMSIAVAADANILVLERLNEENTAAVKPIQAVESGYNNAWSSIRDAAISTLIICVVLYFLASRFGEASVQGFALVLGLGVVLNIANISLVTRTLLRGIARSKYGDKL